MLLRCIFAIFLLDTFLWIWHSQGRVRAEGKIFYPFILSTTGYLLALLKWLYHQLSLSLYHAPGFEGMFTFIRQFSQISARDLLAGSLVWKSASKHVGNHFRKFVGFKVGFLNFSTYFGFFVKKSHQEKKVEFYFSITRYHKQLFRGYLSSIEMKNHILLRLLSVRLQQTIACWNSTNASRALDTVWHRWVALFGFFSCVVHR